MQKIIWSALASWLIWTTNTNAQTAVEPKQFLWEQVRLGEASYRDNLVQESLHRLALIAPNDPQLLAAKIKLALRQDQASQAQALLKQLAQLSPDSSAYREANNALLLASAKGREQLQQARLLATAGRIEEAQQAYLALFSHDFPTLDLAVEYWRLAARFPEQRVEAITALQALDKRYPNNINLRTALVNLLLATEQSTAGISLLRQMIAEPSTRRMASERWLEHISNQTISDTTLAQLQELAALGDPQTAPNINKLAQQQQSLLANPAFRARLRGLSLIEQGNEESAILPLRQALAVYPDDVTIIGGLGVAYGSAGQRSQAIGFLERALKESDPDDRNRSKWQELLATYRYWVLIEQGDTVLEQQQFEQAQQYYQRANQLTSENSFAWLGLGQVALAKQEPSQAEVYFREALNKDALNSSAMLSLFALYRQQSLTQAEDYLNQLTRQQRQALGGEELRLRSNILQQKARVLEDNQQWSAAVELLQTAQSLTPNDVWLNYRLANNLRQNQQPEQADRVFRELAARLPEDPQQYYAHALYLSSTERGALALSKLARLPKDKWSQDISELATRLEQDQLIVQARQLREQGKQQAAEAVLREAPPSNRLTLVLADWALEDNYPSLALAGYRKVLQQEPRNSDAQLGEVEALLASQQPQQAKLRLKQLSTIEAESDIDGSTILSQLDRQRRMSNAWLALKEPETAQTLLSAQQQTVQALPASAATALWWRDAARVAQANQQPQQALDYYHHAMEAGELSEQRVKTSDDFTRLTRIQLDDDWLARSIRSDAGNLYQQRDMTFTFNQDYQRSSGTGGYSDLTAHVSMLELSSPVGEGRGFVRSDIVQMDAGRFSDANYSAAFGTCQDKACNRDHRQTATGVSLGLGWENERWQGDLGTTPLGFAIVDWVGSLNYNNNWQAVGWQVGVSRRPITSSLLAFAGTQDPNTQHTWGGVRVSQLELSGSYDQGEAHGLWTNLDLGILTGKNVADNQRYRLMGGYYYKLINEDHRRISLGLNSMWWQYQKDLSGYTLGQGGYYSPQQYFSMAVPLNYRQRIDDWSWELSGSASWSRAATKGQSRYPISGLLPSNNQFNNEENTGGSSSGVGYTLEALVERRLSSHWYLGAAIDIQQAKDYTPSHGLLYVRYSFGGWQGDLDMPPQPLIPYGDF